MRSTRPTPWQLAAPILLLLLCATTAHAELELYRPQHRPAAELLPLARTALAGEGTAAIDPGGNALLLQGEPAALRRTRELLAQLDRALQSVVLHYESREQDTLEALGIRIVWQVDTGSLRIGNVRFPGDTTRVVIAPEARREQVRSEESGMLRVLDGHTASLASGVLVPVTTRHAHPWYRTEHTQLVDASSGIQVTPRVLPDGAVRLALEPFSARVTGTTRAGPVLERSGASTTVVVRPGETVAIAGLDTATRQQAADLSGVTREHARSERVLLVRVELD